MYEIIAVTNRKLCEGDFLEQVRKLAALPIRGIILREKDLSQKEYICLAKKVLEIMENESPAKMVPEVIEKNASFVKRDTEVVENEAQSTPALIMHTHINIRKELCNDRVSIGLHIPLSLLRELGNEKIKELSMEFDMLGTSIHAPSEAHEAEKLGMSYLLAGHVFETDCKMGLPGRGTDFIRKVCENTSLPVYGIGGITEENAKYVIKAGAAGVCQMSQAMKKENFDTEWLMRLG